jgi:hypothetical protein
MTDANPPECLPPHAVKQALLAALASGSVNFTQHALTEMAKDKITQDEALAVLRAGVVEPGELERGSWRYRFGCPGCSSWWRSARIRWRSWSRRGGCGGEKES